MNLRCTNHEFEIQDTNSLLVRSDAGEGWFLAPINIGSGLTEEFIEDLLQMTTLRNEQMNSKGNYIDGRLPTPDPHVFLGL